MGYDSRIIVVDRSEVEPYEGKKVVFGDEIFQFNLRGMGSDEVGGKLFYDIFTNEIDFPLYFVPYTEDGASDEELRKDRYGKVCKWATLDEVISWLTVAEVDYRRAKTLLEVLKGIKRNEDEYDNLVVVHFGE